MGLYGGKCFTKKTAAVNGERETVQENEKHQVLWRLLHNFPRQTVSCVRSLPSTSKMYCMLCLPGYLSLRTSSLQTRYQCVLTCSCAVPIYIQESVSKKGVMRGKPRKLVTIYAPRWPVYMCYSPKPQLVMIEKVPS
jgi:hypothetical protein